MEKKLFPFLAVILGFTVLIGCDKYNRAAISADGRTLAFSLGGRGFVTDNTSEMYRFDVDNCTLKRLTVDNVCDAWADLFEDQLVYTQALPDPMEGYSGNVCMRDLKTNETFTLATLFANTPVQLSKHKIFFSSLDLPLESNGSSGKRIVFNLWQPYSNEKLATFRIDTGTAFPFSTLPAFFQDKILYYALADVGAVIDTPDDPSPMKKVFRVEIFSLDLDTRQNRRVTEFYFEAPKNKKDLPVGYVDLDVSPDNQYLICCFLPPNEMSIKLFDDQLQSIVYIVRVETGEKQLIRSDVNMYYPRWKPLVSAASQPSTRPVGKDRLAFVYLSGTGHRTGRGVWISDPSGRSRKLADLPDKVMQGYTGWTWLTEQRIRIFHVGKSGLILIDINADGTNGRTRSLSPEKLAVLQQRADLAALIDYFRHHYETGVAVLANLPEKTKPPDAMTSGYQRLIDKMATRLRQLEKQQITYDER